MRAKHLIHLFFPLSYIHGIERQGGKKEGKVSKKWDAQEAAALSPSVRGNRRLQPGVSSRSRLFRRKWSLRGKLNDTEVLGRLARVRWGGKVPGKETTHNWDRAQYI